MKKLRSTVNFAYILTIRIHAAKIAANIITYACVVAGHYSVVIGVHFDDPRFLTDAKFW